MASEYIINLFMWGYQGGYQVSAKIAAERLFGALDVSLRPQVFLVGVLMEDRPDRHPTCLEPEDCGYEPQWFSGVLEDARQREAENEKQKYLHTHPIAQQNHDLRLKLSALRSAVGQVIQSQDEQRGVTSFLSPSTLIDGYRVYVVLQLDRAAVEAHYALTRSAVPGRPGKVSVSTSLLDATIEEYLGECAETLLKPNPGAELNAFKRDSEEVARGAANRLMYTASYAGGNFDGLHGFFRVCNTISSLRYEGAEGIGKMIVARRGHPNVEVVMQLQSPVPVRDPRGVRKLLEISSLEADLLCDSGYVYGLGRLTGTYEPEREDLFSIDFVSHHVWELAHEGHVLMRVAYGQPSLPRHPIERAKFESDCRRIFGDGLLDVEKLWPLVLEAAAQKHGTMLVISGRATDEAVRLNAQSTGIKPLLLSPSLVRIVTGIDGSVLLDPGATCHAIGVILDGIASEKGSSSRGARYNSAVRYAELAKDCLIVVVSEDGSVELVPDLMPQISRSAVESAVDELKVMARQPVVSIKKFNELMEWFSLHEFYLLVEDCNEVNHLRPQVESRLEASSIWSVYSDLKPDPEMNGTYFLKA